MLPVNLVKNSLKDLERSVLLTVFGDDEMHEMYEFVKKLKDLSNKIECEYVNVPERRLNLPAIKIHEIYFHAVPKYSELESFLFALKLVSKYDLKRDVKIVVTTFVSQLCPNCKATVDAINKLTTKYGIEHHIVDIGMFPEFVEKYNISSVPTTIIGDMVFVGSMNVSEAEKWIKLAINQDYYEYIVEKLMRGEMDDVKRLAEARDIGRVLGKLVGHREFMVRLGAMATIEALYEEKPEVGRKAKEEIIELLNHDDDRIREDAAMMLGMVGGKEDIENLKKLMAIGGRIGESAKEAIENIKKGIKDG